MSKRYLGLETGGMKQGDTACIFPDTPMPFIPLNLKPRAPTPLTIEYVRGIM
jgi:hypothetical protein